MIRITTHYVVMETFELPNEIEQEIITQYGEVNKQNTEKYMLDNDVSPYIVKFDTRDNEVADFEVS